MGNSSEPENASATSHSLTLVATSFIVNSLSKLTQIVSGGQTGVDRAALDVAIFIGLEHGGWCPLGRRAEDGPIADFYDLKETESANYRFRTEKNVLESDGTLIFFRQGMSKGTALTSRLAEANRRPLLCVDLHELESWDEARLVGELQTVSDWIDDNNIGVLNVAGPRESSCDGIGKETETFLIKLLKRV